MCNVVRLYPFLCVFWNWPFAISERTRFWSDEYQLYTDLFSAYNNHIRPVRFHHDELKVSFDLALYSIIQLNTHDQILSTNAEMIMKWNDSHLQWVPETYNGTEVMHVPYNSIWYPDVVLYNTASNDYQRSIMRTNAMIRHTGEVELVSHVMFQSTCDVDISWYPFDRQECKMHFASWTYDVTKIQVTSNQADLSEFSPNPEFFLENFFAEVRQEHDPCCEQPFSTIFAFLLPADSGEKISLAMSSLVAMMVFLMAVTIDIPPSSVIPLIGRYYISCIILLGINVVLCVVSVKCKHDVNSISERLGYITKIIGRLCLLTPPPKVFVESKEELPTAWQSTSDHGSEGLSVHSGDHVKDVDYERRTLRALERIRSIIQHRVQQERAESEKTSEALFFCLVLDRCFFALLIFATVVLNLEFLLASPHSHSFEYCPYGHGACPPDFDYKKYEQLIESGQGVAGFKLRSQH